MPHYIKNDDCWRCSESCMLRCSECCMLSDNCDCPETEDQSPSANFYGRRRCGQENQNMHTEMRQQTPYHTYLKQPKPCRQCGQSLNWEKDDIISRNGDYYCKECGLMLWEEEKDTSYFYCTGCNENLINKTFYKIPNYSEFPEGDDHFYLCESCIDRFKKIELGTDEHKEFMEENATVCSRNYTSIPAGTVTYDPHHKARGIRRRL